MTNNQNGKQPDQKVRLSHGVRIYSNGADELRIRKGIWNFEEAILTFDSLSKDHKDTFVQLFELLEDGQVLNVGTLPNDENLTQQERDQVAETVEALRAQNYLQFDSDSDDQHFLYQLLGGKVDLETGPTEAKPVLFFADTQSIKDYAISLAGEMNLPLTVMTDDQFKAITAMNLTTKFEAYDTRKQFDELLQMLKPYGCLVGCLERPHIAFLRNLNRGLVQTSQAMSLALLDGPFTTLLTIKPPETACFECFENRLLARLEEMSSYQQFVDYTRKLPKVHTPAHVSPLMHSLASQALFEGFLISKVGKAKFAGRVLNTYLPIMEIQVQNLLRVPYCPACGFISESRMDEMYSSSSKLIEKLVERVITVAD